jgi:hypothetical protein
MRRKYLIISVFFLITFFAASLTHAAIINNTTINSSGVLKPISVNLDPIESNKWSVQDYSDFAHNSQFSNVHLDYSVTGPSGGPSIRIDPIGSSTNSYRECDGLGIAVKPGQHITFSCWIKTSASSYGDKTHQSGGRIAIDMYDKNWNGICPTFAPDGQNGDNLDAYDSYVNWGKSAWTLSTETFVVAAKYEYIYNSTGGSGAYTDGDMVVPAYIVPWMQVWSGQYGGADQGKVWFADPELYITN